MNVVILAGIISSDLNIYDSSVAFNIAVKKSFKKDNEPDADFFRCVAFGKTKEFVENYMGKGSRVAINGELRTGKYIALDGTDRKTTDVIINRIEFTESKKKSEESAPSNIGFVDAVAESDELPFR